MSLASSASASPAFAPSVVRHPEPLRQLARHGEAGDMIAAWREAKRPGRAAQWAAFAEVLGGAPHGYVVAVDAIPSTNWAVTPVGGAHLAGWTVSPGGPRLGDCPAAEVRERLAGDVDYARLAGAPTAHRVVVQGSSGEIDYLRLMLPFAGPDERRIGAVLVVYLDV